MNDAVIDHLKCEAQRAEKDIEARLIETKNILERLTGNQHYLNRSLHLLEWSRKLIADLEREKQATAAIVAEKGGEEQ